MNNTNYRNRSSRGLPRSSNQSGRWFKTRIVLSFLLFGLVALWLYFPLKSSLVETYYSQTIYPAVSSVLSPIQSMLGFPLALIALLIVVLIAIYNFIRVIRFGGFWRWLVGCIFTLSLLSVWFFVAWGANYQRIAVVDILELESIEVETQSVQLELLATYLLDVIEREADPNRNNDSNAVPDAIRATSQAMQSFVEQQNINPPTLPENVKYWPKGSLLVGFSASGVMLPWFIEPTVDSALADADLVAIAAHELAHAAGFATEGDADFVGILAGLSAENSFSRYAAALRSYRTISSDLPDDLKTKLDLRLPSIAKSDWNDAYNVYLEYQAPQWLKQQNQTIYDSYLQSQGIEAGIKDYSRSTQLLIQAMQKGLLPK